MAMVVSSSATARNSAVAAFEARQREIALVAAQHGMTKPQQHLAAEEQFVAKGHADRLRRVLVGLSQVFDCMELGHAESIAEEVTTGQAGSSGTGRPLANRSPR